MNRVELIFISNSMQSCNQEYLEVIVTEELRFLKVIYGPERILE